MTVYVFSDLLMWIVSVNVFVDYAEQFAEIEEATDVEVVSSAATQDKVTSVE